jgi:hypothetical protein
MYVDVVDNLQLVRNFFEIVLFGHGGLHFFIMSFPVLQIGLRGFDAGEADASFFIVFLFFVGDLLA